jgi:hypothetical protein
VTAAEKTPASLLGLFQSFEWDLPWQHEWSELLARVLDSGVELENRCELIQLLQRRAAS